MKVNICGFEYKNIRGVRNLNINFEKSERNPYPVTLLMMPNGTGKTTTITLLRSLLNNQLDKLSPDAIRDFKPEPSHSKSGKFGVKLTIDDEIYFIDAHLDYQKGSASVTTSKVGKVKGGQEIGYNIPNYVKDMFTEEFVKRFIFDGELAKEILSIDSGEAEASIKYMFQLNRIDELKQGITRIVEQAEKAMEKSSVKTERGIKALKDKIDVYNLQMTNLLVKEIRLNKSIEECNARIQEIDKIIGDKIVANKELGARSKELKENINKNMLAISSLTQSVLEGVRLPYQITPRFAQRIMDLSTKLQNLKLPSTTSKQFFEDLTKEEYCVCGRPIGDSEKQTIIERSKEYLAEDQIGVINAIKQASKDKTYTDIIKTDISRLSGLISERQTLKTDLDRLQLKLEEAGDNEVKVLSEEKSKLEIRLIEDERDLKRLTTKDRNEIDSQRIMWDENFFLCSQELNEFRDKLGEATQTIELAKSAQIVKAYLKNISEEALRILKSKMIKETNDKIRKIIKNDTIFIESIDGSLRLKNKSNASVGQTLAIAYSFLGSMFENSSHELPFVVDSPAGALDLDVRREVSSILPSLFKQLIVFITSGEREGFTEHFYEMDNDVQFITIISNKDADAELIEGVDKFKTFQDKESIIS